MLSNLGAEGIAAEDGPRLGGGSIGPGSTPHPLGTGAEPTGEGVCCWLTRLNRHFGDNMPHLLIAPSKWGTYIPVTGECIFGGQLLAGEVRTSSVVHRQRLCVPFAIRQVRLAPRIASR